MFSDLQDGDNANLYHDGGFFQVGMNPAILGLSNS